MLNGVTSSFLVMVGEQIKKKSSSCLTALRLKHCVYGGNPVIRGMCRLFSCQSLMDEKSERDIETKGEKVKRCKQLKYKNST